MHGGSSNDKDFTPMKLFSNVFISFVGAGVLGLPYAFKEAGLLQGTLTMIAVSCICIKAMLLIVDCKALFIRKAGGASGSLNGLSDMDYGELALHAFGKPGWWAVQLAIVFSQVGFCCAYLIFITENLQTLIGELSYITYLGGLCVPLSLLVLIRDLKGLSIFSLFADLANVLAYCVVFFFDFERMHETGSHPKPFKPSGLIFFVGVCVYCFEGAGMVLALETSVPKNRRDDFPYLFTLALSFITTLYVLFGGLGYASFGEDTESIITLNLPPGVFPNFIKACLCFSLYFTYPVMLFPVSSILDKALAPSNQELPSFAKGNMVRVAVVITSALVVLAIPDFASIMGLIGSTCCMLLALIMPGLLHLHFFKGQLSPWQLRFDYLLVSMGSFFMLTGTSEALGRIVEVHSD
eukprot:m.58456 g.58456  ORF g.58456 m.58456 type:complete len:409 (+) comp13765_c0_seq1:169-1395(+)